MPLSPLAILLLAASWFSLFAVVVIVSGCVEDVAKLIGLMLLAEEQTTGAKKGGCEAGESRVGGACHP